MPIVKKQGQSLDLPKGTHISEALKKLSSEYLSLPCGGKGTCGKCRVTVKGICSEPTQKERECLSKDEFQSGVRLACQTTIEGDVEIEISAEKLSIVEMGVLPAEMPGCDSAVIAVDIGTTTISAALYAQGDIITRSLPNPQAQWCADVITRMEKSLAGEGKKLAEAVKNAVAGLASKLISEKSLTKKDIKQIVITGNTAMLYFLTEENVDSISRVPFEAKRLFGEKLFPNFLETELYICPCASAFVGADVLCAVLAAALTKENKPVLLADIGTNGEIALWNQGRLYCCSTAAGPVFEGAGIRFGMHGGEGAIDHVSFSGGKFKSSVIGGGKAAGICGSGVVDAVAALIKAELLDETGLLQTDSEYAGKPAVMLSGSVWITQEDIRKIQLAKSAVQAGMKTLTEAARIEIDDIKKVYIAGGFGSHLNPISAAEIGLIPKEWCDRIVSIGNGALSGALLSAVSEEWRRKGEQIASKAETVILSSNPTFTNYYMEGMFFEL